MSKTNVINPDYEALQLKIQALTEQWSIQLAEDTLTKDQKINTKTTPVIPQLNVIINLNQYRSFILDLIELLKENQPNDKKTLNQMEDFLTEETLQKWLNESIAVNMFYFEKFAEENDLPAWLPSFVAEHAVRPFLQKISAEIKVDLEKVDHHHGCPACGEPARLALLNKLGRKEITCPRCRYSWVEKKISCAHCGNEDHDKMVIIKVDGDESAEIHACQVCNGYTKVIDARKRFAKLSPEIHDLKSIHLDYIAQEKGYGTNQAKDTH